MAILNREEFFARLNERLGNDTSDESIKFLEDMTDTYNDLETRANNDAADWERKYHELDETWKKRYRHRFFNGSSSNFVSEKETEEEDYEPEEVSIEKLFEEKKEG